MLYDHIPADNRNLLTVVDNFGYVVTISNKNLKLFLIWLNFDLLFLNKPDSLHSDIDAEFFNATLKTYLEEKLNHIQDSSFHSQCQGAAEAFNKTFLSFYI